MTNKETTFYKCFDHLKALFPQYSPTLTVDMDGDMCIEMPLICYDYDDGTTYENLLIDTDEAAEAIMRVDSREALFETAKTLRWAMVVKRVGNFIVSLDKPYERISQ